MPLVAVDSTRAKELDELAQRLANPDLSQAELETTQAKMILLQEELDWAVYAAFGLEPAPDADAELPAGLQLGERAFEIAMARRMEAGELQTTWFVRHGSTPRTTLPDHWSSSYRAVVERRLEVMDQSREMRLLEQPEHKRRWVFESWEDRVSARSRSQALDGIEEALRAGLSRPTAITVNQLADRLAVNQELTGALSALNAEDQDRALADLVRSEAVPAMPVEYLKPPGLRKRAEWEKVWAAQVVEDPFLEEQDQVLEAQFGSTPEEQRRARAHVACWKTSDLVTKEKGLSDAELADLTKTRQRWHERAEADKSTRLERLVQVLEVNGESVQVAPDLSSGSRPSASPRSADRRALGHLPAAALRGWGADRRRPVKGLACGLHPGRWWRGRASDRTSDRTSGRKSGRMSGRCTVRPRRAPWGRAP